MALAGLSVTLLASLTPHAASNVFFPHDSILSAASFPALDEIKLFLNDREIRLKSPALYDRSEVYLPLESLPALGAEYRVAKREDTVTVQVKGEPPTEFALARPGGQPMVPLSAIAGLLHAEYIIKDGVCRLKTRNAPASRVAARDKETPATPLVLDLPPARQEKSDKPEKIEKPTTQEKTGAPASGGSLQKSDRPDDTKGTPNVEKPVVKSGEEETAPKPAALPNRTLAAKSASRKGKASAKRQTPGVPAPPVKIQAVAFEATDENHAKINIRTTGNVNASAKLLTEPSRLAIDIPNSVLESEQKKWNVDHPFVSAITATAPSGPGTTRIVLDLARLVGYRVMQTGKDTLTIALGLPRGAGRRMRDLVVVVDPGHGAHDKGCSCVENGNAVMEKNLTLAIAKKVRDTLAEEGVNVILTRSTDVFIPLKERPGVANENNADLFVSIHIDDCPRANTASGTTSYYHMNDANSRALAHSIVSRIAQVSGLPSRGARSDSILYGSGLSVLRNSLVPATLVEIGYINNAVDRHKMTNDEFQQSVAQAIVNGIRGYIEGKLPEEPLGSGDRPMGSDR
jgi:N-acetylmuramoyl-L-alanine amidase